MFEARIAPWRTPETVRALVPFLAPDVLCTPSALGRAGIPEPLLGLLTLGGDEDEGMWGDCVAELVATLLRVPFDRSRGRAQAMRAVRAQAFRWLEKQDGGRPEAADR
jgi:hypothetical protein